MMRKFKPADDDAGKRADIFVVERLKSHSRASLKPLFTGGFIKVNNRPARLGYRIRTSDIVTVDESPLNSQVLPPELPVLYEDDDVVVIDKPAGMLTHSKGAVNHEPTVADFLLSKITDKRLDGNRAGIVHRLDRWTSGVIIGAKNKEALRFLQKQFSARAVEKTYIALVYGVVDPPEAIVDVPIERNPKNPPTFRAGQSGKTALTQYRLLKSVDFHGTKCSLVELKPKTGRTHQLRVHMAYVGHPLVGDRIYGKDDGQPMMLHAVSLEVILPDGQRKEFKSPLPAVFKSLKG